MKMIVDENSGNLLAVLREHVLPAERITILSSVLLQSSIWLFYLEGLNQYAEWDFDLNDPLLESEVKLKSYFYYY